MRTTLDIDDEVLAAARSLAAHAGLSLGAAVSELARRGFVAAPTPKRSGFPVFGPSPDGHTITDEIVARHRDDP